MSKRKYEPGAFMPCSPKHKSCSPAHASLVMGYRVERERQLVLFEASTGGYKGDIKLAKENGVCLINFKTWLMANSRQTQNKEIISTTKSSEEISEKKTCMDQNQIDQMFSEITTQFTTSTEQNSEDEDYDEPEEECNCDCCWCLRRDHAVCAHDCRAS